MLVNPTNAGSDLLLALAVSKPKAAPGKSPSIGNPLFAGLGVSLAPGVSDALLRIAEIVNGRAAAQKAAAIDSVDPGGYVRSRLMSLDELPAGHADRLKAFGADGAVRRVAPEISQAEFENLVMDFVADSYSRFEGFDEAIANGTLTIRKARDVPELGFETVLYDMYKDGNHFGGAGWSAVDSEARLEARKNGIMHALGSINGHDYVVTWAMPWEAHNAWLGTL